MLKNPLRYPGGKTFLAGYVARILEVNRLTGCTFYEPYAGSAAVSLELLHRGLVDSVVLVEKDPLIYSFWKAVIETSEPLCKAIDEIDVSLETWRNLLRMRNADTPLAFPTLQLGLAGLFYNRTNYSGILAAGPLGGQKQESPYKIGCRFNKTSLVNQIRTIAEMRDKITVKWDNALSYLRVQRRHLNESNCFVYIDPPYYQERAKGLYRFHYSDRDHIELANFIKQCRYPWLISYDDHPFIEDLYFGRMKDIRMQWLYMDYSAQKHKRGSELLISNRELPPAEQFNSVTVESAPGS